MAGDHGTWRETMGHGGREDMTGHDGRPRDMTGDYMRLWERRHDGRPWDMTGDHGHDATSQDMAGYDGTTECHITRERGRRVIYHVISLSWRTTVQRCIIVT